MIECCDECGKEITTAYYFDDLIYCYECYDRMIGFDYYKDIVR